MIVWDICGVFSRGEREEIREGGFLHSFSFRNACKRGMGDFCSFSFVLWLLFFLH